MSSVADHRSRVVVVGTDDAGRSAVVSDAPAETRVALPVLTINDLWQVDQVPCDVDGASTLAADVALPPPPGGVVVRIVAFPPDSEWQGSSAMAEASAEIDAGVEGDEGFHVTDTVDVGTVLEGEMYAVLEAGETVLRPGDSLIQRGTAHAWSNRGSERAVMLFTMMAAKR